MKKSYGVTIDGDFYRNGVLMSNVPIDESIRSDQLPLIVPQYLRYGIEQKTSAGSIRISPEEQANRMKEEREMLHRLTAQYDMTHQQAMFNLHCLKIESRFGVF